MLLNLLLTLSSPLSSSHTPLYSSLPTYLNNLKLLNKPSSIPPFSASLSANTLMAPLISLVDTLCPFCSNDSILKAVDNDNDDNDLRDDLYD